MTKQKTHMVAIKPEEYKKLKDYYHKTNIPIWRIIKDHLNIPEDGGRK
jgi:hypothetical protein